MLQCPECRIVDPGVIGHRAQVRTYQRERRTAFTLYRPEPLDPAAATHTTPEGIYAVGRVNYDPVVFKDLHRFGKLLPVRIVWIYFNGHNIP